ncbi:hypothetical protein FRC09_003439 [Ceratobasidium sp. 395]|nr:hypothetical protein FRC09_003439 [Ceratobasidium sp. 395]
MDPPATGFMLEGTIQLFRLITYNVSLRTWYGPPPPDIKIGVVPPIYQRAYIENLCLADLGQIFQNSLFSAFELTDSTITYQNYPFVKTIPLGWTIEGNTRIGQQHEKICEILGRTMNVSLGESMLRISVFLGLGHSWNDPPHLLRVAVRGVYCSKHLTDGQTQTGPLLSDGVVLSRIAVIMYAHSVPTPDVDGTERVESGLKIVGDMHLTVPGSILPLDLDFEIEERNGVPSTLEAAVKGDVWENAFGTGLRDLGCEGVADLFRHYTGDELSLPSHINVAIGSATVKISESGGLSITLDKLAFGFCASSNASLELSHTGALVHAKAETIVLPGAHGVKLVSAFMQISFEKIGSSRPTSALLSGKVVVDGLSLPDDFSAEVHLYQSSSPGVLEWTLYGNPNSLGNPTSLKSIFPEISGSPLGNWTLHDLLFIASSRDDPPSHCRNPYEYPVSQGIQFLARIDEVGPVNRLLRCNNYPGLILRAMRLLESFAFTILLPTDITVNFGLGIATYPIALSIDTKSQTLDIAATVQVSVPGPPIPLGFNAVIPIKDQSAIMEGIMHTVWENPFGVGYGAAIGPPLVFGMELELVSFSKTGLLKDIWLRSDIVLGNLRMEVDMSWDQTASKLLLAGEVECLSLQDLVSFTKQAFEIDIPMIPQFIEFQHASIHINPNGRWSSTQYPPGFSLDAEVHLFRSSFRGRATIAEGSLRLSGDMGPANIGPLKFMVQDNKGALLDLQISSTLSQLDIEGSVQFYPSPIELTLHLDIQRNPAFSFSFPLDFTDLFTYTVSAESVGEVDLQNLSELNFSLNSVFENHLVEHIQAQVLASFEALKNRTMAAIQAAEKILQDEESQLLATIRGAEIGLQNPERTWTQRFQQVVTESDTAIASYQSHLDRLHANINDEYNALDSRVKDAQNSVQFAKADRVARLRLAKADAAKRQSNQEKVVVEANQELEIASRRMMKNFGNAEDDLKAARIRLDRIYSETEDLVNRILNCDGSPWYRFDLKAEVSDLVAAQLQSQVYLETQRTVVDSATKFIKETNYPGMKHDVAAAKEAVRAAQDAYSLTLRTAQSILREIDFDTASLVARAESLLTQVQADGKSLIGTTELSLKRFVDTQHDSLDASHRAVDELTHSAEWLNYKNASAAVDCAKHSKLDLDIMRKALETAKEVVEGKFSITEEAIADALAPGNLTVTNIELSAMSGGYLNLYGPFPVTVEGTFLARPFTLSVRLFTLMSVEFVHDIFIGLLKELERVYT